MRQPIPDIALDKHVAFLGATGSGKTSAAKSAIVEPALEAGERVLVIDPTGAWWGLRVGIGFSGYSVHIFGGDHGDYPLRAKDAGVLAEVFGTSSDSAIFDTSLMNVAERTAFFTEFAETIRRKNRGPLKLILDEAHLFMPQSGAKAGGAVPAMLHAGNNLVSLGRSKGLRITLISQRPAKLHKDSLTQVQSMIAMRLMAPQDRKAISEWIADQADPTRGKDIIASDSSRAPTDADAAGPDLTPINLDALRGRLSTLDAETKANDPKALKAEIAKLTATVRMMEKAPAQIYDLDAEKRGFDQGHTVGYLKGIAAGRRHIVGVMADAKAMFEQHYIEADRLAEQAFKESQSGSPAIPAPAPTRAPAVTPPAPPVVRKPSPAANGDGSYSAPQRRILESLAFWRTMGHEAPSREQVAGVAGYSPGSGNFQNLLGSLKANGSIDYPSAGCVQLQTQYASHMTADDARRMLDKIMSGPERKVVQAMLQLGGEGSRDQIAEGSGYSAGSGNFQNILGGLRSMCIIDYPRAGAAEITAWAKEILA